MIWQRPALTKIEILHTFIDNNHKEEVMKLIDAGEVAEAFHRRKQMFDLLRSDSLMLAADMEGVTLKPSANQRVNALMRHESNLFRALRRKVPEERKAFFKSHGRALYSSLLNGTCTTGFPWGHFGFRDFENLLSKAQLLEEAWNDNVIVECNENNWGGTVTLKPNLSQRATP